MTKHTKEPWSPEPWSMGTKTVADSDGGFVCLQTSRQPRAKANMKRMVTCVNSMAGISNPQAYIEAVNHLEQISTQISDLYAGHGGYYEDLYEALKKLEEARG